MTLAHLVYPLRRGFVNHWLLAGPYATSQATSRSGGESVQTDALTRRLPAEIGKAVHLDSFTLAGKVFQWQYQAGAEDHFLHLSPGLAENHRGRPAPFRAWAYTEIWRTQSRSTLATLTTNVAFSLWCNGQWLEGQQTAGDDLGTREEIALPLRAGANEILVELDWPAQMDCAGRLALRLEEHDSVDIAEIRLPTRVEDVERFQAFEAFLARAYTDRNVFVGNDMVQVHWPADMDDSRHISVRLEQSSGRIYAETLATPKAAATTTILPASALTPGEYEIVLMPQQAEYSVGNLRVRRSIPVELLNSPYRRSPDSAYLQRMMEGIQGLLRRRQGLLPQLAAITLDLWQYVNPESILATVSSLDHDRRNAARDLLALAAAFAKYGQRPQFPSWLKEAVVAMVEQHSGDVTGASVPDELSETQQLLHSAWQIVAAQVRSARSGAQIDQGAEAGAMAWLLQYGHYGSQTSLMDPEIDDMVFALACLAALAQNTSIRELATIALDKLLFTLAINSHQGIGPGGLQGPASGIGYLMWGAGAFNRYGWGLIGLADSGYAMPTLLAKIALDIQTPQLSIERHRSRRTDTGDAVRITYRLAEGLLASVAEGSAGQRNNRLGRWHAILGPQAIVSTNHPVHCRTGAGAGADFWHGDGVAPHLGQWQDALIAIYSLPTDDWLGYTHAHFPRHAFDQCAFQNNWAFGCCGNGYVALTASVPIQWMDSGPGARRELRAVGHNVSWVCQLGNTEADGSFADFQEKVLALPLSFGNRTVHYTTLRGAQLAGAWQQPLQVDGRTPAIADPMLHYDTPFCRTPFPAEQMDIQFASEIIRLEFI